MTEDQQAEVAATAVIAATHPEETDSTSLRKMMSLMSSGHMIFFREPPLVKPLKCPSFPWKTFPENVTGRVKVEDHV